MKTSNLPQNQLFHIDGVLHIDPVDAMELLQKNEAVLIDVREPDEIKRELIPLDNVLYHPMSVILDRIPYISKNQNIILICPKGERSSKVANLLNRAGYPTVANLDGGFGSWKEQGFPFTSKLSYAESLKSCGCGCNSGKSSSC